MTDDIPGWVWDLLIDLEDQRDTHPRLLYQGPDDGPAPYDWCPCKALERVPAEILQAARALRGAMRRHHADIATVAGPAPAAPPAAAVTRSSDTALASVLTDLDRCVHGRHAKDPCLSCPDGQSASNPHLRPGQLIGYGLDGTLIVVPYPADRYDAKVWRRPRPDSTRPGRAG